MESRGVPKNSAPIRLDAVGRKRAMQGYKIPAWAKYGQSLYHKFELKK